MNNILTFEDYKKMNIRQVESVIYRQFIEENIKEEVNEGLIRKAINKAASKFIQSALEDEIKKGKELEKSIKEALDGLDKGFDEIKQKINANNKDIDPNSKLAAIEKVKEAIKAVQSQAFDTLTMIGSEGEIDFAGFLGSGSVIAAAHFGILFSPISSIFITRKAYKYFLGIIKQTIRRNLLIIQLNFDQFENLILQKSFEAEGDSEATIKRDALNEIIGAMTKELVGEHSKLKVITGKTNIKNMKDYLAAFQNAQKAEREFNKNSPLRSLWEDQHNNTYTRTLEQIKQYINDDSQKELDALKNSITKMAGNDVDLVAYGELMISAAEEYAVHTNHGINNNFIKMSSVFNLENQKKLIDLIQETQKENENEIKKREKEIDDEKLKKDLEEKAKKGKDLYEDKLKGKKYTFDEFEKEFDNESVEYLKAFFQTDEGKDEYKELTEKEPLYKYLLDDTIALSALYDNMSELNVIEINSIKDFSNIFVEKKQSLYYLMSGRSIRDAVRKKGSDNYFGFNIKDDALDETDKKYLDDSFVESDKGVVKILTDFISPKTKHHNEKKRYFLNFNGSGDNIFNILHKEFNTEIFKSDGTSYNDNISIKNKEIILKIIQKNLNIGKSISTQLSEYLVMLEAHMLLKKQDPWFVVKDNQTLFDNDCFNIGADKIENVNAFIEINPDEYSNIKKFLFTLNELKDNDYNMTEPDNK